MHPFRMLISNRHLDVVNLAKVRREGLRLLRESPCQDFPAHLAAQWPNAETTNESEFQTGLALAYLDELLRGREPQPSVPTRDEQVASIEDLLDDTLAAAKAGDPDRFRKATAELAFLADSGHMPRRSWNAAR